MDPGIVKGETDKGFLAVRAETQKKHGRGKPDQDKDKKTPQGRSHGDRHG
jgi:hypothetical protein